MIGPVSDFCGTGVTNSRVKSGVVEVLGRVRNKHCLLKKGVLMGADSHDLDRICGNCNYGFPSEPFGSDFAICLNDPDFEPYVDDMLENQDFSRCQNLIRQKRFSWEQEACPDFDPVVRRRVKSTLDSC